MILPWATAPGRNLLVTDGKTICAFMCAGREENPDADREMFTRVMETHSYC